MVQAHLNSYAVPMASASDMRSRNFDLMDEMRLSAPSGTNTRHASRRMMTRMGSKTHTHTHLTRDLPMGKHRPQWHSPALTSIACLRTVIVGSLVGVNATSSLRKSRICTRYGHMAQSVGSTRVYFFVRPFSHLNITVDASAGAAIETLYPFGGRTSRCGVISDVAVRRSFNLDLWRLRPQFRCVLGRFFDDLEHFGPPHLEEHCRAFAIDSKHLVQARQPSRYFVIGLFFPGRESAGPTRFLECFPAPSWSWLNPR